MKLKLRIFLYKEGKKLVKKDLENRKDNFSKALRYITEYKYLEASKWLMLAEDCFEKYALLVIINIALGNKELVNEFLEELSKFENVSDIKIVVDNPERGLKMEINKQEDIINLLDKV